MSLLSSQVEQVEKERDSLRSQLRAMRAGNVVLIRRDGFCQIKQIDIPSWGMYSQSAYSPDEECFPIHRINEYYGSVERIDFWNTGRRDACGRWIFEEH